MRKYSKEEDSILSLICDEWMPFGYIVDATGIQPETCRKVINSMVTRRLLIGDQSRSVWMYANKKTSRFPVRMARIYHILSDMGVHAVPAVARRAGMTGQVLGGYVKRMPEVKETLDRFEKRAYVLTEEPPVPEFLVKYQKHFVFKESATKKTDSNYELLKKRQDWFFEFNAVFVRMADRMRSEMGGFIEPYEFVR